jgi:hypothetical protein
MNYRSSILLSPADVDASGTKIVDLDFPDVISRLQIIFQTINPGAVVIQEHPLANLTKIEIVDGSNVVFSLTGLQTHALEFFDTGRLYPGGGSFVPAWGLVAIATLNFGRFLFDPLLALAPKKFTNLQLKVSYDEDVSVASTVVNTLAVIADLFDEKTVTPTGFLMNKDIFDYTPVANAIATIDLPTDYTYRKLMVQARVPDLWFGGIIGNLKLTEDNDKRIPLDLTGSQLESWLHQLWGECSEHIVAFLNTSTGIDLYHAATQGIRPRADIYCASDVLGNVPFGYRNAYKTTTAASYQAMEIAGTMPHGCICIPFGDQQDPADWYNVVGRVLKLKLTAGASIGATEQFHIIGQQYRPYAAV